MVVILLMGMVIVFAYFMLVVPTKWLKVEVINNHLGMDEKALQISDIHIKNTRVKAKRIVKVIKREKPNYIFYTGDFIDRDERELKTLEAFIGEIAGEGIESYAVLGNHDRYLMDLSVLERLLEKYNVRVLKNESVVKEKFTLIGIDDYCKGYNDEEMSFKDVEEEVKKIVLTHDPNIVEHMVETFDLMLTGHLHGKQINVPFLFRLKPMGPLPKKGIYKGEHKTSNGRLYISKGLGQSRWNIRFMVRSEVTIHNL